MSASNRSSRKGDYPVAQPFAPPPGWQKQAAPPAPAPLPPRDEAPPPEFPSLLRSPFRAAILTALAFVSVLVGWLLFHGSSKSHRPIKPADTLVARAGERPRATPEATASRPKEKSGPAVTRPAEPAPQKPTEKPQEKPQEKAPPQEKTPPKEAAAALTFETHVLPIFKQKCVNCHGAAKKKGGVDVRTVSALLKGGENGPSLVPGSTNKSILWETIESDRMPPGKPKLTAAEKEMVKKWIHAGAKDERTAAAR